MSEHPQLKLPPIDEVVCGFVFAPQPVDTMDFGIYWDTRLADYPGRQVHPALMEGTTVLQIGASPQRSWLISEDDSRVLQLQHDRFFMNWRRRDGDYPRFSDHDGKNGLRTQAIAEFEKFGQWLLERTKQPVQLARYELTKIDTLKRGKHYESTSQLGDLMSVAKVFADIQVSEPQLLNLRLVEAHDDATTHVQITVTQDGARIETRHVFPMKGDMAADFTRANFRVNNVFFGLFKDACKAFGGEA